MAILTTFAQFLLLGAINHQITIIVVESVLFRAFRERVAAHSAWFGELVSCHLCFGTWVGFLLAAVFRPGMLVAPTIPGAPPSFNRWFCGLATFFADSFLIALSGRIFNELLGLLRREVAVTEEEKELLAEEVEQLSRDCA